MSRRRRTPTPLRWAAGLGTAGTLGLTAAAVASHHPILGMGAFAAAVGSAAIARGSTWGVFVLMASSSLAAAPVALSLAPAWLLLPAALPASASAAVTPVLLRRDALATIVWAMASVSLGAALAAGMVALHLAVHPERPWAGAAAPVDVNRLLGTQEWTPTELGRARARVDLAAGKRRLLGADLRGESPHLVPCDETYERLLEEELGVRQEHVLRARLRFHFDCHPADWVSRYIDAYDEVVQDWIREQYGPHAIHRLRVKVRAQCDPADWAPPHTLCGMAADEPTRKRVCSPAEVDAAVARH